MLARITSIVLAVCICAVAKVGADQPTPTTATQPATTVTQTPAPLKVAFDQIDRTINAIGTPPPLDGFASDLQAIKDAQTGSGGIHQPGIGQMAIGMIPVIGTIYGLSQAAKQKAAMKKQMQETQDAMNGNKPGVLTRYAFYNGWSRVETASSIVITKPDQHLVIYIDPLAKTYHTYDTTVPTETEQTDTEQGLSAPAASSGSGQAAASALIDMAQADPATIGGQSVVGYSSEAIVTLSNSSGSCQDGTFKSKKLEYVTQLPEPLPQEKETPLEMLALPDGCSATIERQTSGTAAPLGQMYVYRLVTVVRDPNAVTPTVSSGSVPNPATMMQSMGGAAGQQASHPNYMKLSERANIRELTAADTSLFDIPSGYTQDK